MGKTHHQVVCQWASAAFEGQEGAAQRWKREEGLIEGLMGYQLHVILRLTTFLCVFVMFVVLAGFVCAWKTIFSAG